MPFSNRAGQGVENQLARLIGRDLGMPVRFYWWAQRRGFVRHTLGAARCDLWPGVPAGLPQVATTRPYYHSSYVFVSRVASGLGALTLDDPRLKSLSIGVQMIGADAVNSPAAHALARRGLTRNVHGFMIYGDYGRRDPAADIVRAVASGQVDVALAWGPTAGYFAARSPTPLRLDIVRPGPHDLPMRFGIAVGVRSGNPALLGHVQAVLDRDAAAIRKLLEDYHIPLS